MQHFISVCGLSLAWVTSENSTSNSNADILSRSSSPWLDPLFLLLSPESGVDCPCPWFHANSLLAVPPLCCPVANCSRPGPVVTCRQPFVQPTLFRVPLPLPDTARFQVQKSSVWFRSKTDKVSSALAGHPYSATRSLSGKYPWERYEPPYPPSYGLNSTTSVLLGEWLWH